MAKKKHSISGTVVYQNLSGGFWGIEDSKGKQWRPIKMPKALQKEGQSITAEVEEVEEEMSIFMWGTPVKVVSFDKI